jgi:hypothetical protein
MSPARDNAIITYTKGAATTAKPTATSKTKA